MLAFCVLLEPTTAQNDVSVALRTGLFSARGAVEIFGQRKADDAVPSANACEICAIEVSAGDISAAQVGTGEDRFGEVAGL